MQAFRVALTGVVAIGLVTAVGLRGAAISQLVTNTGTLVNNSFTSVETGGYNTGTPTRKAA
jgi:hypothetical protein